MDVRTAVAASMLPASRAAVAAAFRELRHDDAAHGPASGFLELLWSVCRRGERRASHRRFRSSSRRRPSPWKPAIVRESSRFRCSTSDIRPCLPASTTRHRFCGCRGDFETLARPAVAVIGSRAASPYALQVGTRIAAELAERGIVVVERPGQRRRFGGPPRMSGGAAARPRRCWAAASIGSIHPSMPIWRLR